MLQRFWLQILLFCCTLKLIIFQLSCPAMWDPPMWSTSVFPSFTSVTNFATSVHCITVFGPQICPVFFFCFFFKVLVHLWQDTQSEKIHQTCYQWKSVVIPPFKEAPGAKILILPAPPGLPSDRNGAVWFSVGCGKLLSALPAVKPAEGVLSKPLSSPSCHFWEPNVLWIVSLAEIILWIQKLLWWGPNG